MLENHTFVIRPLEHLKVEEIVSHFENITHSQGIEPHVINKVDDPLTHFCGLDHNGSNANFTVSDFFKIFCINLYKCGRVRFTPLDSATSRIFSVKKKKKTIN